MAFKETAWDLDNVTIPEYVKPEAGLQYLLITGAKFDAQDRTQPYEVSFHSLQNGAEFTLKYWIFSMNPEGAIVPDRKQMATVISLKTALAGRECGVPNPVDIVGGIVAGDVIMQPSKSDPSKSFARIYEYLPVTSEVKQYSQIEQFYSDE